MRQSFHFPRASERIPVYGDEKLGIQVCGWRRKIVCFVCNGPATQNAPTDTTCGQARCSRILKAYTQQYQCQKNLKRRKMSFWPGEKPE